jgi:hypothetical protein
MKKTEKTNLSLTAINKDLTFSRKSVWLWVKLSPTPYEFLDYEDREALVKRAIVGYSSILVSDDKAIECQLILATSDFDDKTWVNDLYSENLKANPSPYLPEFLGKMDARVHSLNFKNRQVFLGVNLGFRNEYTTTKSVLPFGDLFNALLPRLDIEDYEITPKELEFWNEKAKNYKRSLLTGNLQATEVNAEEIAYITKKQFFPSMPIPEIDVSKKETWGRGEIDYLVDSAIENHSKYLKITQDIDGKTYTGYRTVLCFARFPDTYAFPDNEPWIHYAASLPFAIDFYSRFTIEPARKVRKDINKKIADIKDQGQNMTSAGGSLNLEIQEQYDKATAVELDLSKNRTPWLYGKHRLIIEAATEDELKDKVQRTIDHYKNLNIQLHQPTGDQLSLFLEGMPNDYSRTSAYIQRQDVGVIPAGLPTGSGSAGDKIIEDNEGKPLGFVGPYFAYTTSRIISPVFYSVHSSIATGNAPGCIITGSPGSGKSFLAFTLTYLMALSGVWSIYIDPKGDAIPMAQLPGIKEKTHVLDLKNGTEGLLDPFSLGRDLSSQKQLALQVINMFLGGEDKIKEEASVAISRAITKASELPNPSLSMVAALLTNSTDKYAKDVGTKLDLIKDLPFAKLCFAPRSSNAPHLSVEGKLTIITLTDLNLPNNNQDRSSYDNSQKLAVGIMYLLTDYTRQLMMNANKLQPKAIIIDEAWAVSGTPQGLNLIESVSRMGRSLNTGLIMVSQNAKDFHGEKITNSVSTMIAFRATDRREIDNILTLMGLDINDSNADVLKYLQNGDALMKDAHGRLARIHVDGWNQEMMFKFETNPEKKRRQEEELKRIADTAY